MTDKKLKPCPFCGATGVYRKAEWVEMFSAGCPVGHAESPEMESKEQAATWWNTRKRS